jgi:hypothetical protein
MAYAAGRIGTGGMFPRSHGVEPAGRARVPSPDRALVYLLTPAGRR